MVILAILTLVIFGVIFVCYSYRPVSKAKLSNFKRVKLRNRTPKVLVFQSSSYPNDKEPEYATITRQLNKTYCDKWKFDYSYFNVPYDQMPVYWLKTFQLTDFALNTDYDYIVWMDLDAAFVDHSINLIELLDFIDVTDNKDYCLYVSADHLFSLFNAGVIVVKNTKDSQNLLQNWHNRCFCDGEICNDCALWSIQDNRWKCKGCVYSMLGYEQYALIKLYKRYRKNICILREEFMGFNGRFINHLCGQTDDKRLEYFTRKLKEIMHLY